MEHNFHTNATIAVLVLLAIIVIIMIYFAVIVGTVVNDTKKVVKDVVKFTDKYVPEVEETFEKLMVKVKEAEPEIKKGLNLAIDSIPDLVADSNQDLEVRIQQARARRAAALKAAATPRC